MLGSLFKTDYIYIAKNKDGANKSKIAVTLDGTKLIIYVSKYFF